MQAKYHFIKIDSSTDYERHNILFDHKMLGINMKMLTDAGQEEADRVENLQEFVSGVVEYMNSTAPSTYLS